MRGGSEQGQQLPADVREEMEAAGVEFHEADRQAFIDMGCGDLVLKYGIGQELLDTLAEIRAADKAA